VLVWTVNLSLHMTLTTVRVIPTTNHKDLQCNYKSPEMEFILFLCECDEVSQCCYLILKGFLRIFATCLAYFARCITSL
jgi:hypothetical protein